MNAKNCIYDMVTFFRSLPQAALRPCC